MAKTPISPVLLALCAIPAAGQSFSLGTPSDPCTGGQPLTIFQSSSTVRWGDFTCTLPVSQDGLYTVELDFLEPCAQAGACAGGQVTKAGQRIENVSINNTPVLANYDPYADMQIGTPTTTGRRLFLLYSHAAQFQVRVQTVVRSGVLAAVVISPAQLIGVGGITITRAQCHGAGSLSVSLGGGFVQSMAGWDCDGIELWRVNSNAFTAVAATPEALALPNCPVTAGPCWQSVRISQ